MLDDGLYIYCLQRAASENNWNAEQPVEVVLLTAGLDADGSVVSLSYVVEVDDESKSAVHAELNASLLPHSAHIQPPYQLHCSSAFSQLPSPPSSFDVMRW